jgi:hypothetical protein
MTQKMTHTGISLKYLIVALQNQSRDRWGGANQIKLDRQSFMRLSLLQPTLESQD